jgi:hypothetical protein
MGKVLAQGTDSPGCIDLVFGRIPCPKMDEDMARSDKVPWEYLADEVMERA